MDSRCRSSEILNLEVHALRLLVSERLGDRRVGGQPDGDVLGRDRVDGFLQRLLLGGDVLGGDGARQHQRGAKHDEAESSLHVKTLPQAPMMWSTCAQKITRL